MIAQSPEREASPRFPTSRRHSTVRVSSALLALMLGAGVCGAAGTAKSLSAPEKFTLAYKAQAGRTKRMKSEGTMNVEAGGNKLTLEVKQTEKVTFASVAPSGNITIEDKTESMEMSVNGQKQEMGDDEQDETDSVTIRPNGTIAAYKSGNESKEQGALSARMEAATRPVFPAKAVAVGDTWSHEYTGDADMGTRDAKADFEVLAVETVGGVETVKLKMAYAESGASPTISGKGTIWVEKTSGDTVSSDYEVENVPLGPGDGQVLASGTMHDERTEGGPLAAKDDAKPAAPPKAGAAGPAKADDTKKDGEKKEEAKKEEPKKEKTIEEIVKGFEKTDGLITLYRKREAGKDTIYAELREDQLNKLMMLEATAATGTSEHIVAGDPINDIVFKFVRTPDEKIQMVTPNVWFRAKEDTPIAKAVRRSFADGILASFKIEAKSAERKATLVDVSDLFKGDIAMLSVYFSRGGGAIPGMPGGGGFAMDRDKTYVASIKSFPDNLVVATQYHFMKGAPRSGGDFSATLADPRSAPVVVNYNVFALPSESDYQPRLADPRVGYFTAEYQSFDDDSKDDQIVRYIYRWNLKKKDPSAALSEPVKPIVFRLDNAIPHEYRDSVRDAILMWNKAFEKAGFKNAVVVEQMPDDADPNEHADMRFNTIRWVVSPDSGYAVALFRVNPLTGQILNANITVDANLVRYTKLERSDFVEPAVAFDLGANGPSLSPFSMGLPSASSPHGILTHRHDLRRCTLAADKMQEAWFGHTALSLLSANGLLKVQEKDYINAFLREVIAHEMGHVVGLRHNFIASAESDMTKLANAAWVREHGTTASVMDYNPFNLAALKTKDTDYFSQTVGTYDQWAVKYGYTAIPDAKTPEAETPTLKQIARDNTKPGHQYQSDEIADQFDPLVARFDLSADPIAYHKKTMQVSRHLLVNLDKRLPRNGESYYEFTRAFQRLLGTYSRAAGTASRYIGGLHVNRNHKGDPNEKPTLVPVDVAKQKEALGLLNTYIFAPNALSFPEKYYLHLTVKPDGFEGFGKQQDFPVRDQISNMQRSALRRLFSGSVLTRVANNEFKMNADPARCLTMPTLFKSVSGNVWAELSGKQDINTMRRQLQRSHLDLMIDLATKPAMGVPDDGRMLAWNQLRDLKTKLAAAKAAGAAQDEYTRIHLDESLLKVSRALDAKLMLGGGESSSPMSLLQLLLGQEAAKKAAEQLQQK